MVCILSDNGHLAMYSHTEWPQYPSLNIVSMQTPETEHFGIKPIMIWILEPELTGNPRDLKVYKSIFWILNWWKYALCLLKQQEDAIKSEGDVQISFERRYCSWNIAKFRHFQLHIPNWHWNQSARADVDAWPHDGLAFHSSVFISFFWTRRAKLFNS